MDNNIANSVVKNVPHILILIALIVALLFLLANFGYIRACEIPGFSSVYYAIKGTPKYAFITGSDGSGNPELLASILASEARVFPMMIPGEYVTDTAVLDPYQVVIVEHTRTMSTQTLSTLQQYVQKGGRLVWIGDAGTKLGENDYVCEKVRISYVLGANYTNPANQTEEQCGDWVDVDINSPEELNGGICAKTFGAVVKEFMKQNASTYEQLTSGDTHICKDNLKDYYKITGADRVFTCLKFIAQKGKDAATMSADEIEKECPVYNYWNRGKSKTQTGATVNAIDFSALVLGFDYVSTNEEQELYMQPLDPKHPLIKGYGSNISYLGVSNITLIDTARFSQLPRTATLLSLKMQKAPKGTNALIWPGIVISNPTLMLNKRGLVIFYAFPPEDLWTRGGGSTLIKNLISYLTC